MAKVRVEIDLLKPQPEFVRIGFENDNSPLRGYYQKLEYEGIPKYCKQCKKLGHMLSDCRVLGRKKMLMLRGRRLTMPKTPTKRMFMTKVKKMIQALRRRSLTKPKTLAERMLVRELREGYKL